MTMTWKMLASFGFGTSLLVAGCATAAPSDTETESQEPIVDIDGTGVETEQDLAAPTCAPSGAVGAVPSKQRAMLDTIAFTEGTAGTCGQDGYNTGFAYHCFASCTRHPGIAWTAGSYTSTAAGRYQFLSRTWSALGYGAFSPHNQDLGGMKLITKRGVTLPTTRALTATEFSNAMKKLSYEWASLPFSPYGQPTVSLSRARAKYCTFAGC